jgi:hypothetical protein
MIREIAATEPNEPAVCTENPIRFPLLALSVGLNLTRGNEAQLHDRFMEDKGPVKTVVSGLGDRDSLLWEERRIRGTGRTTTTSKPLSAPGCNAQGSGPSTPEPFTPQDATIKDELKSGRKPTSARRCWFSAMTTARSAHGHPARDQRRS